MSVAITDREKLVSPPLTNAVYTASAKIDECVRACVRACVCVFVCEDVEQNRFLSVLRTQGR